MATETATETPAATQPANPAPSAPPAAGAGAPPKADAGAEATTLAEGGGGPDKPATSVSYWRDDWAEKLARGDPKKLERMRRYASIENFADAHFSMLGKMAAGEIVGAKPDGKDPEALNLWRNQVGIPEKPDGYLDKVPDGLVFGEHDKPMLESFLAEAHKADMPPQAVHLALQWYKSNEEKILADRSSADLQHRQKAEDTLRAEFGPEFRPNLNGAHSLVAFYGSQELANDLYSARLADGTPLGDHPGFLRLMVALNREINPHGTVAPTAGQTPMQSIDNRLGELKKLMSDKRSEYWQGPSRDNLQAEYRNLIDMQSKHKSRAA